MVSALVLATTISQTVQWTPLVRGNSLDGWVKRGGTAEYRVENGTIIGETRPNTPNTFLCTEKVYGDFELELEFKVHDELNSGVQFRSNSVSGYQNGRVHGYQAEIDPSDRAWTGGVYDEGRRAWIASLENKPEAQKAFKKGEWNKFRILAVGDHIQVWTNGVKTTDFRDDMTRTGFVALQVHGVGARQDPLTVSWRNIRIKDFGDPVKEVPEGGKRLLGGPGDTANWQAQGSNGQPIGWKYSDGVATCLPGTTSIETREMHEDCDLYVEFMVDDNGLTGQANGNSGVYLMGRYEVQVLNSAGQEPADNICGGIYGVKAADFNMAYPAYEWQNYYIQFTAPKWSGDQKVSNAKLTVWHNGTLIHRDVEVPGTTTAGVPEGLGAGRLALQNHGNRVSYRNIWMRKR